MSRQLYEFTDRGHQIHGIVHIGINEGQEIPIYIQEGWGPVIGFEPLAEVYLRAAERFKGWPVRFYNFALGNENKTIILRVPYDTSGQDDTMQSSMYQEGWRTPGDGTSPLAGYKEVPVPMVRFDDWAVMTQLVERVDLAEYSALVIDVQGMELEVLKGAQQILPTFKYLVVECSREPIYWGEPKATEVVDWLAWRGYERITPILDHDDIMFLKQE